MRLVTYNWDDLAVLFKKIGQEDIHFISRNEIRKWLGTLYLLDVPNEIKDYTETVLEKDFGKKGAWIPETLEAKRKYGLRNIVKLRHCFVG